MADQLWFDNISDLVLTLNQYHFLFLVYWDHMQSNSELVARGTDLLFSWR